MNIAQLMDATWLQRPCVHDINKSISVEVLTEFFAEYAKHIERPILAKKNSYFIEFLEGEEYSFWANIAFQDMPGTAVRLRDWALKPLYELRKEMT